MKNPCFAVVAVLDVALEGTQLLVLLIPKNADAVHGLNE